MQRDKTTPVAGFTLIELILVMAILTVAVSITAPALSNFFRGRSLDLEARRLLALTRQGQSRAVSEGVPTQLWLDAPGHKVGLEIEPSYETVDARAVEYTLETELQVDTANPLGNGLGQSSASFGLAANRAARVVSNHPNLPRIRFMPDGYIAETSPSRLGLVSRDGSSLYLVQTTNRLGYEIRQRLN